MKTNILLTADQIQAKVKELAHQISIDFKDKDLVVLGVLKGSFIFLADLVREMDIDPQIEFITLSSYKNNQSTGKIELSHFNSETLKEKHVLVVEDIIDTGLTINFLKDSLGKMSVSSLSICSLLLKEKAISFRDHISYLGFVIPNEYVFGYGLDDDGYKRSLDHICIQSQS